MKMINRTMVITALITLIIMGCGQNPRRQSDSSMPTMERSGDFLFINNRAAHISTIRIVETTRYAGVRLGKDIMKPMYQTIVRQVSAEDWNSTFYSYTGSYEDCVKIRDQIFELIK